METARQADKETLTGRKRDRQTVIQTQCQTDSDINSETGRQRDGQTDTYKRMR